MIGAIAGDIIGSVHEGGPAQPKNFRLFTSENRFTDDTVLTVAVASAIRLDGDYRSSIRRWGRLYPNAGYGGWFRRWLFEKDGKPYNSFGNGSAMRVSAVGWAFDEMDIVLRESAKTAQMTHNHPEGVKGAQAVAATVLFARTGHSKSHIKMFLAERFGYDCSGTFADLQCRGRFDITCQGTVPAAGVAFLESVDFEDAVRNAVSLGGDTDTLACIAGSMAEAYYQGVPVPIQREVMRRLDPALRAEVLAFAELFHLPFDPSTWLIRDRDDELSF